MPDELIAPCLNIDWKAWWGCANNPAFIVNNFAPTSRVIYLQPFTHNRITQISLSALRFKFSWVPAGLAYRFVFRAAIYRAERGIGGTAATWVKVGNDLGSVARQAPVLPPAYEYVFTATTIAAPVLLRDGIYAIAFQWEDLSLPGSAVTFASYGYALPSFAGWWYFADGAVAGGLPVAIATVGAPTPFQIYWESR